MGTWDAGGAGGGPVAVLRRPFDVIATRTATSVRFRVGALAHFLKHFSRKIPSRVFHPKHFRGRVIEAVAYLFDVMIRHHPDVALAGQPSACASVGILHRPFLPRYLTSQNIE
jgi:hypothetical protein